MEADWGRLHPLVELSQAEIARRLGLAGLPALASASPFERGKANTNLRIDLIDGSRVVLRIYTRVPEAMPIEAALLKRVAGLVPAPRPLHMERAEGWLIESFLEGEPMESVLERGGTPNPSSVGRTLAAISQIRFSEAGFLNADLGVAQPFADPIDGYVDYMLHLSSAKTTEARLGAPLVRRTSDFIRANLERLKPYHHTVALVHSDFKPSNLLLQEGEVSGVLDWEFAHAGLPLLDVAILTRDERLSQESWSGPFAQAFVAEGGFLTEDWQAAARYLDLVNLLDFVSRPESDDRIVESCRHRIVETVDS